MCTILFLLNRKKFVKNCQIRHSYGNEEDESNYNLVSTATPLSATYVELVTKWEEQSL